MSLLVYHSSLTYVHQSMAVEKKFVESLDVNGLQMTAPLVLVRRAYMLHSGYDWLGSNDRWYDTY